MAFLERTGSILIRGAIFANAVGIGSVLCWTGMQHANNRMLFYEAVIRYELLPQELASVVATTMPFVELFVGISLIARAANRFPYTLLLFLATVFLAGQVWALSLGLNIECGCFGALHQRRIGLSSLLLVGWFLVTATAGIVTVETQDQFHSQHPKVQT